MISRLGRKKKGKGSVVETSSESGVKKPGLHIDHAFASTGKAEHKKLNGLPRLAKYKRLVIPGLVAIAIVAGGLAYYFGNSGTDEVATQQCSQQLLSRAAANFEPSKYEELEKIVNETKQVVGYEQDPDCVYVALTYYINISDAANARKAYEQLKTAYDPEKGYEPALGYNAQLPEKFKPIVEFLEKEDKKTLGPDGAPR